MNRDTDQNSEFNKMNEIDLRISKIELRLKSHDDQLDFLKKTIEKLDNTSQLMLHMLIDFTTKSTSSDTTMKYIWYGVLVIIALVTGNLTLMPNSPI